MNPIFVGAAVDVGFGLALGVSLFFITVRWMSLLWDWLKEKARAAIALARGEAGK